MSKVTSELLLSLLRDAGPHPLGVHEILTRGGLHPGARTSVKRELRELIRTQRVTGEGKRFRLSELAPRSPAASAPPPKAPERSTSSLLQGFVPGAAPGGGQKKGQRGSPKRMVGVLHKKRQGYGFVSPVAARGEDQFLPTTEALSVSDGDLVQIEIVPGRNGRSSSRLISIVERRRTHVLGRYERRGRFAVVVPRNPELAQIPVEPVADAREGDEVRVRLPLSPEAPGVVEGVVGAAGDPRLESLSVAYGQGFSDTFPPEALEEAAAFPGTVTREQRRNRRDLTKLPLVTIDGEDARDFDDAVYVEDDEDGGGTRLVVAIADVASYVKADSAIDVEALRRCTSVYFPDRVLPMLPERLSNELCSLMPEVERLCLVADLVIDGRGRTRECEIYPAVMRSAARCTYTQVAGSLTGEAVDLPKRVTERFPRMQQLAKTLARMREERGAIDFNLSETKVLLRPDGTLEDVVPRERNEAHRLIESFMLAANEAVADWFLQKDRTAVFRIHDEPDAEKLEAFLTLARTQGFEAPVGQAPDPQALNAFLASIAGKPEARALNSLMLRSMMQAAYSEHNIGHYGLGAEAYLHFTSPIRRYPDLMVHRLLWLDWLQREAPDADEIGAVARRCSERERAAMSAEREIESYYAALWARDRVGETFTAVVDGVSEAGVFAEIDGHGISGLVPAEALGMSAELDKEHHRWLLGRSGASLSIGDALRVKIVSASVGRRQIDLGLDGARASSGERAPERTAKPPVRDEASVAAAAGAPVGRERRDLAQKLAQRLAQKPGQKQGQRRGRRGGQKKQGQRGGQEQGQRGGQEQAQRTGQRQEQSKGGSSGKSRSGRGRPSKRR